MWINCINSSITFVLYHPWKFEIPIAYKLVYLNMNLDFDHIQIDDFLDNNVWNIHALNCLFGRIWDSQLLSHGKITPANENHWVWFPKTNSNNFSTTVYNFLNRGHSEESLWSGWANIWNLHVAPRTKSFLWIMIQGKLKTYGFLYRMNLGPPDPFVLYGLDLETSDHLFRLCSISHSVWSLVNEIAGNRIQFEDYFTKGDWLEFRQ